MTKTIQISLKAGEKIFVNGAVMRTDRKVKLEFLNDVTFLLENHVMLSEHATTPLKQLYFIVQTMLIDPPAAPALKDMFQQSSDAMKDTLDNETLINGLINIDDLIEGGRTFAALKEIRALFHVEDAILKPHKTSTAMDDSPLLHRQSEAVACK